MENKQIQVLLKKAKDNSKKRKFVQTYDLVISLKSLDLKKNQMDFFVATHFTKGKKANICALVGPELSDEAKKICDNVILVGDFKNYEDKKAAKKLANSFDFFIAQSNIMNKVASSFGRVFGPRGKMPNPKIGCVVPPKANLQPLYDKLQKTVRISIKKGLMVQAVVGNETMRDEEVIDNIKTIYDQVVHHMPNEKNNISQVYLKTTMGKPAKLEG